MESEGTSGDLQSRVLQNTLAEVAARGDTSDEGRPSELCCVICLDNIAETCEARPCRHRNFDYLCLLSWLERSSKCPLCKSDIHEVLHDLGHQGPGTSRVYLVPQVASKVPDEGHVPAQAQSRVSSWRGQRQERRRYGDNRRQPQPATQDEAIVRRQEVYRNRLYSLHVGSNSRSRYREITPASFESEPELLSRARAWLRRELQVFEFLRTPSGTQTDSGDTMTRRRANNAEFLLEYIIAILKTVDIQGSQGAAEDMLSEFLGRENTRLLLHELRNFLRSPWSIEAWDRKVQYPSSAVDRVKDDAETTSHRSGGPVRNTGQPSQSRLRGDSYRPAYPMTPYDRTGSSRRRRPG
ncbi:hypothetical protein GGS20DRAFT_119436 [Poronia punctata]|nr:hypothetical protein GGS20DRAFT_119436 [Poronia punctata]